MICKNVSPNPKSWLPSGDHAKTLTWRVGLIIIKFLTCTLYINCFILSLTSNRQEMVATFYMYCYMVGVVKHWMQTDVHISVSQVSVSESLLNAFKE